jgi:hypothetical protein
VVRAAQLRDEWGSMTANLRRWVLAIANTVHCSTFPSRIASRVVTHHRHGVVAARAFLARKAFERIEHLRLQSHVRDRWSRAAPRNAN